MKTLTLKEVDLSRLPITDDDKKIGPNKIFLNVLSNAVQQKQSFDSIAEARQWDKVWDKFDAAKEDGAIELSDEQFDFVFKLMEKFKPSTGHVAFAKLAVSLVDYLEQVKIQQKNA